MRRSLLSSGLLFWACLVSCAPATTLQAAALPTAPTARDQMPGEGSVETQLLARLNALRASGVRCPSGSRSPAPALTWTAPHASAAAQQAGYMAATGRVSHNGADGSTPRVRAASFGVQAVSVTEIIYMGARLDPNEAVAWWTASNVHCTVMTDPRYTEAGVSVQRGPRGTSYVVVFSSPSGR